MSRWPDSDAGVDASLISILRLLRDGAPRTRAEIIDATGLGRKVVTQRVDLLVASGLVTEGAQLPSTGGRPPSTVAFRPQAGLVLVAEVSPSAVRAGASDLAGRLLGWSEAGVSAADGPEAILDLVCSHWETALRSPAVAGKPVMAIGIGIIGPVDTEHLRRSTVVTPYGWDAAHVRTRLSARFGVPVWADNAVNVMALAEYRLRSRADSHDLVLVLIDDGIGAGLVSNGRLHRGADGIAGELGHITVSEGSGIACWCGKSGCLTQVASCAAIERALGRRIFPEATGSREPPPTAPDDAEAAREFARAGAATGQVLASLVNVFNPSEIVLGGRVPAVGAPFLEPLRAAVRAHAFAASAEDLPISVTTHEDELGLMGAGLMALDGYLSLDHAGYWLPRSDARDEIPAVDRQDGAGDERGGV